MSNILVRPSELHQISEQLLSSAKKIDTALKAIDNDILSLKGDKFLGNRASAVQMRYAPKRDALLRAKEIVTHFSKDLRDAATRFEQADRGGNSQPGTSSGATIPSKPQAPVVTKPPPNKLPKISEIILNQWDKRWGHIKMNNLTGETLRNYGCLITVISMIARANGVEITPDMVDKWNDKHGVYVNGSNMPMTAQQRFLTEVLGRDVQVSTIYQANSSQNGLTKVAQNLASGTPVVLHINSSINPQDGHFVLAVGVDSKGNYICADPNGGKQVTISVSEIRSARVFK